MLTASTSTAARHRRDADPDRSWSARPLPGLAPARAEGGLPARAASGETVQQRRAVRVRRLPSRSVINRCTSERVPFDDTINPYRGCELGCVYCYARYTHDWLGLDDPAAFETEVFAKTDAPERLLQQLGRGDYRGRRIAIGTVTDPYQPAERRLMLTRRLLEVLGHARDIRLSLTTKSDLVVRDADLLEELSRRHDVTVNMTVVTPDTDLARRLEPRAPRPDLRLAAVRRLNERGIRAGVFAMPVLPGITDGVPNLEALFAAASRAGARFLCAAPLFVRDGTRAVLFDFLQVEFPHLLPRYRRAFARSAYLPESYRAALRERLAPLRARFGLPSGPEDEIVAHESASPDTEPPRPGAERRVAAGRDTARALPL